MSLSRPGMLLHGTFAGLLDCLKDVRKSGSLIHTKPTIQLKWPVNGLAMGDKACHGGATSRLERIWSKRKLLAAGVDDEFAAGEPSFGRSSLFQTCFPIFSPYDLPSMPLR